MRWSLSLLVGVLTSVAGCTGTGLLAYLFIDWFRIGSMDGEAGFTLVGLALLGLLGGLVVGVVSARATRGFPRALGVALGASAAILALITGLAWLSADFPPTLDGEVLVVEIEVRLPPGLELPADRKVPVEQWHATITADTGRRHQSLAPIRLADAHRVDGAWIVPARVYLTTSDPGKTLGVMLGDAGIQYFPMSLPGWPGRADMEWCTWQADSFTGNWQPVPAAAAASVRYRVQYDTE